MSDLKNYTDKTKRLKYLQDYQKSNYKAYKLQFNIEKDKELIKALDESKNKSQFIRDLFTRGQL